MDASYKNLLPPEQWRQVLENIGPGDLCNVMLTSRYMSSLASCPNLWAGMKVNMRKVRDNGLMELYSIDRFRKIRKMDFLRNFNSEQLETALHEIPTSPLQDINLGNVNLSKVPSELLANAISGLQTVNLFNTALTTEQCIQLLEASLSSRSLVDVNLALVDLSGVPSDLLARAVFRLQTVNLYNYKTKLTTEQCIHLLEASLSSRSLVDVNLEYVNLSGIPSDLLARAVSRLQTVNLYKTKLTTEQCIQVLEVTISSRSLVNVNLAGVDLSGVLADLLARAVSRLQTVNLYDTKLTNEQCIQVAEASILSRTLIKVYLSPSAQQEVPKELLAKATKISLFSFLQSHPAAIKHK